MRNLRELFHTAREGLARRKADYLIIASDQQGDSFTEMIGTPSCIAGALALLYQQIPKIKEQTDAIHAQLIKDEEQRRIKRQQRLDDEDNDCMD